MIDQNKVNITCIDENENTIFVSDDEDLAGAYDIAHSKLNNIIKFKIEPKEGP
jgi:hypothetical protein